MRWQTVHVDEMRGSKKQMKAQEEKIIFFEKHNRHSKTFRKKQMLKQVENAYQYENAFKNISKRRNICVTMRTFFFPWRKYPACDCSLPEEKSTNIQENVRVYFRL